VEIGPAGNEPETSAAFLLFHAAEIEYKMINDEPFTGQ